jgi:hypothetical protein
LIHSWHNPNGRSELAPLVKLAVHMGISAQILYNKQPGYRDLYGEWTLPMMGR